MLRNWKTLVLAFVVLLALGLGIQAWLIQREPPAYLQTTKMVLAPTPTAAEPRLASLPLTQTTPRRNAAVSLSPVQFVPPDEAAMIEVDKVNLMLRDYRTLAGGNPVGTNAEIMAAVMGKNPKQAKLGPPEGMHLNESGELIDRWGTPYFFHQLSRDHMEIRSAGADRVLWTEDDAVIK